MAERDIKRPAGATDAAGDAQRGASFLEPGQWVRNPVRPDWGPGQVQSVVGARVTVNFENAGKILVNVRVVGLERDE